jgi:hypothetical protein
MGRYQAIIGASSKDIRQEASFEVEKEIKVKTESKALTPLKDIDEIKRGS